MICVMSSVYLQAQSATAVAPASTVQLSGVVIDVSGKPVADASVLLRPQAGSAPLAGKTDPFGRFNLAVSPGTYTFSTQKDGAHGEQEKLVLVAGAPQQVRSILLTGSSPVSNPVSSALDRLAPELVDKPNFSVAGVTDWTAVGGHGSDAVLRTSESLARDAVALKSPDAGKAGLQAFQHGDDATETQLRLALSAAPHRYDTNHNLGMYYLQTEHYREALSPLQAAAALSRNAPEDEYDLAMACRGLPDLSHAQTLIRDALRHEDAARFHRLASQIEEQLANPLAAVREQELATRMEPSEGNYFELGSELLLHRAIWQASQTFASGAQAYPGSARMKTAWGTALFAGALYDESARQLCAASDLNVEGLEPYEFIGKIVMVSSASQPCIRQKLERYLKLRPNDANPNFFFAMLLLKQGDAADTPRITGLLKRAVALDPNYAAAHLQLGILAFAKRNYGDAVTEYAKAIQADEQLGEAHYRLAVAYEHLGKPELAREQFRRHDEIDKAQAATVEQQRREIKQFVVTSQAQISPTVQ